MENTKGEENFDYTVFRQQAIQRMLAGDKELTGKDGLLAPLLKTLLDAALSGERQAHVEQNRPNRRNGSKTKPPGRPLGLSMVRNQELPGRRCGSLPSVNQSGANLTGRRGVRPQRRPGYAPI
ncbi:hypothetical protein GCM10027347_60810 [Larkinella harenae]